MKKIIILLMGMVLVLGAMSCSVDAHDDLNEKITESENTESSKDEDKSNEDEETPTAESEDEDNVYESKDDSEKEDEESPKLDESSENTTETKEDTEMEETTDEDNTDESDSIENINADNDSSDNSNNENKTWCYIDENINILELNYIAHYEDSTYKFNSDINDSSVVKSIPFTMRCNASSTIEVMRVIVITVTYDNGTLNFSINNQSPYYIITNVIFTESNSNIDIYIQHK